MAPSGRTTAPERSVSSRKARPPCSRSGTATWVARRDQAPAAYQRSRYASSVNGGAKRGRGDGARSSSGPGERRQIVERAGRGGERTGVLGGQRAGGEHEPGRADRGGGHRAAGWTGD